MNDSQQKVSMGFLLIGLILTLGLMQNTEAMKTDVPEKHRNFHASSGVPVDVTDKPYNLNLRSSLATSYEPNPILRNHSNPRNNMINEIMKIWHLAPNFAGSKAGKVLPDR